MGLFSTSAFKLHKLTYQPQSF